MCPRHDSWLHDPVFNYSELPVTLHPYLSSNSRTPTDYHQPCVLPKEPTHSPGILLRIHTIGTKREDVKLGQGLALLDEVLEVLHESLQHDFLRPGIKSGRYMRTERQTEHGSQGGDTEGVTPAQRGDWRLLTELHSPTADLAVGMLPWAYWGTQPHKWVLKVTEDLEASFIQGRLRKGAKNQGIGNVGGISRSWGGGGNKIFSPERNTILTLARARL